MTLRETQDALNRHWAGIFDMWALMYDWFPREKRPSRLLGPAVDPGLRGCCRLCGLRLEDCEGTEIATVTTASAGSPFQPGDALQWHQ